MTIIELFVTTQSTKFWRKNGTRHRDNGLPAIIFAMCKTQIFYEDGRLIGYEL